jgi:hypothetical protein
LVVLDSRLEVKFVRIEEVSGRSQGIILVAEKLLVYLFALPHIVLNSRLLIMGLMRQIKLVSTGSVQFICLEYCCDADLRGTQRGESFKRALSGKLLTCNVGTLSGWRRIAFGD